jgi:ABC-type multidrug transport system ATPase subunit
LDHERRLVQTVLQELELDKVANIPLDETTVRMLHESARKRVSMATEVVADPISILLDDPV